MDKKYGLINKKGFTLIELLAVIVILGIISLIATPIILGVISDARESSFRESLNNTFHAFELYEANNGFEEITEKISVTDKEFPLKSKFKTGVVFRNEDGVIEVDYISDGTYCAAGTKTKLSMVKGKCDILDKTEAVVDVKINKITTNSITVVTTASDPESGIEGIYYKINNGEYKKGTERNTFGGLEENKEYTISVRVVNGDKVETVVEIKATTLELEEATYEVSSSEWAKEKTVTINYPEGENLTYEYSIDKGKTWVPAEKVQEVEFTSNGTLIAKVKDGENVKTASTLTIDKIDTTKPIIESVEGNTNDWSKSKTLIVTASDEGSGILEYSFDNGESWQESNEKEITENGTYEILVKDLVGNISEVTEIVVSKIDDEEPEASISVTGVTTKSISVSATCNSPSGISKYEFSKDNGANYTANGITKTYTFENLVTGTYNIKVRCTSNTGLTGEGSITGTTGELDNITFGVPSGWAQSKEITINYPDNYTYRYRITSGTAKVGTTNLTVNTWYETTNKNEVITFTSNGVIVAEINDGENTKLVSQNITEIDTEAPSVPTSELRKYNSTGELIPLPNSDSVWYNHNLWWGNFNSTDNESGVDHYEYSDKCTGTKAGNLSNSYTYPNKGETQNYSFCIRAVDKAGNASDWSSPTYTKIDKVAPTISKVEGNTDVWSRSKTLVVTANETGGSLLQINAYSFDNGENWQSSNEKEITANGTYNIKVRDNAGNISDATSVVVSKIDTTSPIVTLGSSQSFARTNNTATFTNISTTGKTNVSCNNGAIPSVSGTTLTVSNVTKDTTCSLNQTLNSAVSASDTSENNIVMLSNETLSSGVTIAENKNIGLNLNSKTITNNSSDYAITVNGKLNIKGTNGTFNGTGHSIYALGTSNLTIDGGTYNYIQLSGNSKANIKNTINKCTNDATNCYPIWNLDQTTSTYENINVTTLGKAFGIYHNASSTIKNSEFNCTNDNCIFDNSSGTLDINRLTINSKGYAVRLQGGGIINIKNVTFNNETNHTILTDTSTEGTINIYSGTYTSQTGNVINNASGTVNIKGGKFIANSNAAISNTSANQININDTEDRVYIASHQGTQTSAWNAATLANSIGTINIKGKIADKCGDEENTTGICIYNDFGRVIQTQNTATAATGIINIDGAYIVTPHQAIANNYGTINICSGKITGRIGTLGVTNGYIYYKANVILDGAIGDDNNPKHVIINNSLTCN